MTLRDAFLGLLLAILIGIGSVVPQPAASGTGSLTGNATWYDAPSSHDAAAGPALRKALGKGWRGTEVVVRAGGHSVRVRLTDWCLCARGNRVVDLDDRAFARLAPLSTGVLAVRVTWGAESEPRAVPTGPPTDLEADGG